MKLSSRLSILLVLFASCTISFAQETVPKINKKVIEYVETVLGETVGRGECWDLADQALTVSGAEFNKSSKKTIYIYGQQYNPEKEAILPGDLIQFEGVRVSYTSGNMTFTENYKHHTAIVYQINPDQSLKLAHQNTSFGGRKVEISDLDLKNVKKGKLYFYHPIP
jgi:hypothetical protein